MSLPSDHDRKRSVSDAASAATSVVDGQAGKKSREEANNDKEAEKWKAMFFAEREKASKEAEKAKKAERELLATSCLQLFFHGGSAQRSLFDAGLMSSKGSSAKRSATIDSNTINVDAVDWNGFVSNVTVDDLSAFRSGNSTEEIRQKINALRPEMRKPSAFLVTQRGATVSVCNEAGVQFALQNVVNDALTMLGNVESGLSVEVTTDGARPDIVLIEKDGRALGVIEVKNDSPDVFTCSNIAGQVLHYLNVFDNRGVRPMIGMVHTLNRCCDRAPAVRHSGAHTDRQHWPRERHHVAPRDAPGAGSCRTGQCHRCRLLQPGVRHAQLCDARHPSGAVANALWASASGYSCRFERADHRPADATVEARLCVLEKGLMDAVRDSRVADAEHAQFLLV